MDQIVYVGQYSWGYGDTSEKEVFYAGTRLDDLLMAFSLLTFPDPWQNFAWYNVWQNGKSIKHNSLLD